ncbi:uncharacterized protein LOC128857446 [Anastrepha ludens]|uniref:uncharacterized protein LOC128857446 n=1 Tax=Anastrepha ludens TaxID=28586 RepID=UPI0023B1C892|nr:uncharacterized protein LOC128857446 [Anastrepha ludens]
MSDLIEQRSAIKFCLRNEISAAETFSMLQKAFGDSTMSQKNVYKWYKDFKEEGHERLDDLERSGRPSTSTDDQHVNKVKELVFKTRRLTDKDHTDMIGVSEGPVKTILKDHLGLREVKSRLVPKTLNFLEKSRRVDVCETMLSDYQDKLKCIITGDETWIDGSHVALKLLKTNFINFRQRKHSTTEGHQRIGHCCLCNTHVYGIEHLQTKQQVGKQQLNGIQQSTQRRRKRRQLERPSTVGSSRGWRSIADTHCKRQQQEKKYCIDAPHVATLVC